jgi:hypothetical protein
MHRPPFTPQEESWYSLLLEAESDTKAMVLLEGLGKLEEKKIHLTGTRTHDLPACSIVSQPTMLQCAPPFSSYKIKYISIYFIIASGIINNQANTGNQ